MGIKLNSDTLLASIKEEGSLTRKISNIVTKATSAKVARAALLRVLTALEEAGPAEPEAPNKDEPDLYFPPQPQ